MLGVISLRDSMAQKVKPGSRGASHLHRLLVGAGHRDDDVRDWGRQGGKKKRKGKIFTPGCTGADLSSWMLRIVAVVIDGLRI